MSNHGVNMPDLEQLCGKSVPTRFVRSWATLQRESEKEFLNSDMKGNFSVDWEPALDGIHALMELLSKQPGFSFRKLKVLDTGSGALSSTNYQAALSQKFDISLYGIDPYLSDQKKHTYEFRQSVMENLPFVDQEFDIVMTISSLDHCILPKSAMAEIKRVTKPGGYFLSVDTIRKRDRYYLKWRVLSLMGKIPRRYNKHHNWAWTERSLNRIFKKHFTLLVKKRSQSDNRELITIGRRERI
jgi:ubiquinone/menaquinone biosynthesis C-methylase UbiE